MSGTDGGGSGGCLPLTFPDVVPSLIEVGVFCDAPAPDSAAVAHKTRVVRVTSWAALRWVRAVAHEPRVVRMTGRPVLRSCGRSLTDPGWCA